MSEEAVRELQSRLPKVSDTIIRHFLSKGSSVEECYEQLKDSVPNSISPEHRYPQFNPNYTNDYSSPNPQRYTSYPAPSHAHDHYRAQYSDDPQWGRGSNESTPHRPPSAPRSARTSATDAPVFFGDMARSNSLMELINAQQEALDNIHKLRDIQVSELSKLREETRRCKEELSDLRVKVSMETNAREEVANVQDLIATIRFDINEKKKKIAMWKSQVEMKTSRDVYTEEGVRWQCSVCGFLNHPLLPNCEHCSKSAR